MATINLNQFNDRIKEAGRQIRDAMEAEAGSLGIQHRAKSPSSGSSVKRLRDRYREKHGAVQSISFQFRRSLVYANKGAGRGMAGTKGSSWLDKHGLQVKTNPKSFGKMATGNRKEKPFINTVLDAPGGVELIATIAAEELGAGIINNMLLK